MLFSEIGPISFEDCVLSFFKESNQGTIVILGFGKKDLQLGTLTFLNTLKDSSPRNQTQRTGRNTASFLD